MLACNNMMKITVTFNILHHLDFLKYSLLRMGRYSQSLDSDWEWLFPSDAPEWVPPHPFTRGWSKISFYTFWVLLCVWDGRQVDKRSYPFVWTGCSFVFGFLFLNWIHCSFISSGDVLGRRKMKVRICSCPKRDKDKEEADVAKNQNQTLSGEKRKIGSTLERQNKQVAKRKFEGFQQVKY